MESSPCEHYVDIIYEDGESKSTCMDSVNIERLLISLKKKFLIILKMLEKM